MQSKSISALMKSLSFLAPKVQKRYLADQVLHTCDNILKARRRKNPQWGCAVPKIGIQGKNMLILYHKPTVNIYTAPREIIYADFLANHSF
jgi:hypothetical protein